MEDQITCLWFNIVLVGTWWWRRQITNLHLWFQVQLGARKNWQNCYNYHLQQLCFDWLMNNSFTYNKKKKEWPQQQGIWSSFKITKTKWTKITCLCGVRRNANVTCVFTRFCDFKVFVTILMILASPMSFTSWMFLECLQEL
jgi:hypothetical protein